jgi:hypothetical protein
MVMVMVWVWVSVRLNFRVRVRDRVCIWVRIRVRVSVTFRVRVKVSVSVMVYDCFYAHAIPRVTSLATDAATLELQKATQERQTERERVIINPTLLSKIMTHLTSLLNTSL